MSDKKVAVLLSTYNGEKYVGAQIHSILTQNYKNLVLVVRDDGSKDKTVKIVKEFMDNNDNIKLVEGKNLGFIKSFFELLKYEDADYYAFADQDDIWLPNKISLAVESLNKLEEDNVPNMAFSNSDYYDVDMNLIKEGEKGKTFSFLNSLYECVTQGMTMVINKKAKDMVLDFMPEKVFFHDWWVYMICSGMGNVVYDDVTTVKYRRDGKNATAEGEGFFKLLKWRIKNLFGKDGLKDIKTQQREYKKLFYNKVYTQYQTVLDTFVQDKYTLKGAIAKATYNGQLRRSKAADLAVRVMFVLGML